MIIRLYRENTYCEEEIVLDHDITPNYIRTDNGDVYSYWCKANTGYSYHIITPFSFPIRPKWKFREDKPSQDFGMYTLDYMGRKP